MLHRLFFSYQFTPCATCSPMTRTRWPICSKRCLSTFGRVCLRLRRSDVRVLKGTVNSDVPRHQKCSLAATKVETASTDDKTVPMDNKTASTDDKTETMFSSSSFCITKVPSIMPPNWGRLQRINVVVEL